MPRSVVIDTDPGIDDALAILLALRSPEFDIRGITAVAGNIGIATTTRNAGRILAHAGRTDIPVLVGAAGPLSRKGFDVAEIHGNDGLGGVLLPEPAGPPAGEAVDWLAGLLDESLPGTIDILALGPLTNIARLVLDRPASARRIGRVIAMAGAVGEPGNFGPRSEFNMAADPEAAAIVLRAGLDLSLIPLDVTRKVRATRADAARLRVAGLAAATAAGELIDVYFQGGSGRDSRPLHDPCVMLQAIAPGLFGIETLNLTVHTGEGPDAGALTIDEKNGVPVDVAMTVNVVGALCLLLERLTAR